MQNTDIYQYFQYQLIVFSNDKDEIELEIPSEYNGGLKTSLVDWVDLEELNKFLELAELQFYPIK